MRSIMQHNFSQTPTIDAPRSKFDRSYAHKTTFDAGWLVPFYVDHVMPGDTFNVDSTIFARLSTPFAPVMDNMMLDTQFFFVPYRLIWDNFRKFMGEQEDPGDSIDYTVPVLAGTTVANPEAGFGTDLGRTATLLDYLGVPKGISPDDVDISVFSWRAYNFIYNEWYRDQNLINSQTVNTDDGPDNIDTYAYKLRRRGKRHDYFTSCLPWPQKGDAVTLPLGTSAPIFGNTGVTYAHTAGDATDRQINAVVAGNNVELSSAPSAGGALLFDTDSDYVGLSADLTNATAATINDIREAFQVQKLLERDARAGTRYSELVRNHFGVNFYDISYRPEYLGGGSTPVNITPIYQMAPTIGTPSHVGDQYGVGQIVARNHGFTKSFVEHGLVMGLLSVRADLTYQQGLDRFLSKSTRYDFYWPSLAHLGEQEVLNKEIYCDGSANDDLVFGYNERYAEYRYKPSQITGLFKSQCTASLDYWHLSQEFGSLPTLGEAFIQEDPPVDRVVQVDTEPHFIMDSLTRVIAARPMPVFGVPGMVDHF